MTPSANIKSVNARLAEELAVGEGQVAAAVRLLDEGATVPFIARYRKEVTGSLDDGQLRALEERLGYLRELDDRRAAVLASIKEQGKLTDELTAALMAADTKARVEDIYLPYKPKRRTKAQIAREAGLEPLADRLLADPTLVPDEAAAGFVGETWPMPPRRSTAPGTSSSSGRPKTPNSSAPSAGTVLGEGLGADPRRRRTRWGQARRHRSSATISSSPRRWRPCRRTACWPCCAARRSRSSRSPSTAAMTTCTWP